ncbi:MAG: MATE family efflux transporter [Psychromonas sp.]
MLQDIDWNRIFKIALPVALQSMLVSVLAMSDVFMVTGLGSSAVAAIGLASKMHFVLIIVMAGIGTGVSVLVAQYFSSKQNNGSQSFVLLGLMFGLVVLVPAAILFLFFPETIVMLLSDNQSLIDFAALYLRLSVPLLFLTHIIIVYEGALRAQGNTMLPLIAAAIAIAINILLNYLLIHGFWQVPALGLAGAAIASDIARLLQVIILLVYLARKKHMFAINTLVNGANLMAAHAKQFWQITWPLCLNFSIWGFGTFAYHAIASISGTNALAAISLVSPIESMYHSLFFGFVNACAILIGQHLGRSEFAQAKQLAKLFTIGLPTLSFAVGLLIIAFSPLFLPLIIGHDMVLLKLSQNLIYVMGLGFWLKTVNMVIIMGILRAGGDNKYVLYSDMFAMWVLALPITWFVAVSFNLDYQWIYACVLIEELVKFMLVLPRAKKGLWLKNMTQNDEDQQEQEFTQIRA